MKHKFNNRSSDIESYLFKVVFMEKDNFGFTFKYSRPIECQSQIRLEKRVKQLKISALSKKNHGSSFILLKNF